MKFDFDAVRNNALWSDFEVTTDSKGHTFYMHERHALMIIPQDLSNHGLNKSTILKKMRLVHLPIITIILSVRKP